VQQQIWGEVADFIPAFLLFTLECGSARIIKIGQHLAKLLPK